MPRRLLLGCLLLTVALPAAAAPTIVASRADAFVAHDDGSHRWTIGSGSFSLEVGFDDSGALTLRRAANSSTGRSLALHSVVAVTLANQRVILATAGSTDLLSATATATDTDVRLTFAFQHRPTHTRISRVYECAPRSSAVELWTTVEAPSGLAVMLSDLNSIDMQVPNARLRWLSGLRGSSADNVGDNAFALAERDLEVGERIEIGSDGRSTSDYVPFVVVDDGLDEFYSGLLWSGSWRIAVQRTGDRLGVNAYHPGVETNVAGRALAFPHAFVGVKPRTSLNESGALRAFVVNDLRKGRDFRPLVTYNTWFPYGADISEDIAVAEMTRAATVGIELFVVDAGWYAGAGANGKYDFTSGLGTYALDADRFPSGFAALADQAHGAGMKFGIWVEPERVALSAVNGPGLAREAWLATDDGGYGADDSAQVCFGTAAARKWVLAKLSALIDASHADYLKWDNNHWTNCNREGHDHGASDGNLAHVQGLYAVLAELRARYPDVLIENVSGGGNRLDFGMLAYTDVGWMDDRSTPSTHVRHNLEGLTFAFPPAYLLSFVVAGDTEAIRANVDPANLIRSRMPGILGFSYRASDVQDGDLDAMIREIAAYKTIRDTIADAHATLLSDQAPVDEASWDVLQEVGDTGRTLVLFGFKNNDDDARLVVRPRDLDADAVYDVMSVDAGPMGSATGADLMTDGIELVHVAGASRAHVLIARAR